jgi:hypothetical protein
MTPGKMWEIRKRSAPSALDLPKTRGARPRPKATEEDRGLTIARSSCISRGRTGKVRTGSTAFIQDRLDLLRASPEGNNNSRYGRVDASYRSNLDGGVMLKPARLELVDGAMLFSAAIGIACLLLSVS